MAKNDLVILAVGLVLTALGALSALYSVYFLFTGFGNITFSDGSETGVLIADTAQVLCGLLPGALGLFFLGVFGVRRLRARNEPEADGGSASE